jgi:hypothetical protein
MLGRAWWTVILVCVAVAPTIAVPTAPGGLVAQVAGTTVMLTWTAPAGVLGYVLEGGSSTGLSNLARAPIGPTPSIVIPGVPPGTYFVRVRAVDATGESAPSNEVVVTVQGPCTAPPSPPFGLISSVSGLAVNLAWSWSGSCPPTNFALHAGSAPGTSNLAIANMGLATSVAAAVPPGTYYVRAYAQNAFGASGPSNETVVQVTAPVVPNYTGTWRLTRTGSQPWITQYSTFTVALVQSGTALSGWILPAGRTIPIPFSSSSLVMPDGRAFFGTESLYNYWNDTDDAYFFMRLDATQNRMTGTCNFVSTCTSATAVRIP